MRSALMVQRAKKLHEAGWTARAIANKLCLSSDNVSRWLRPLEHDSRVSGLLDHYHRKRLKFLRMDPVRLKTLTRYQAKLFAAILYWCEGSKYPASSALSFTSSDPEMQRIFIGLLRKGFDLDESKFSVWLQIHDTHNKVEIFKYWSELLDIPVDRFIKPKVTKMHGRKYRNVYQGTCSVRYSDYSIILRLMGMYKRFGNHVLRLIA